jgi:prophage regulatory protein
MPSIATAMDRTMNDTALLRLPAVCELTGYKRSSIYNLIKVGKFPKSVRLAGGGAVAWRAHDVKAWIDAQGQKAAA